MLLAVVAADAGGVVEAVVLALAAIAVAAAAVDGGTAKDGAAVGSGDLQIGQLRAPSASSEACSGKTRNTQPAGSSPDQATK